MGNKRLFFLINHLITGWTMINTGMAQDSTGSAVLLLQDSREEVRLTGNALLTGPVPVSQYTNFRMASVSKQFTAACIIILKNQGKLSYEDPLLKFFPEFKTGGIIRLKHLLTHTSGLPDYEALIPADRATQVSDADVVAWLESADKTHFPPGTRYRYSNSGFCVLAEVVGKASGMPYARFVRKYVLEPLEMNCSYMYEAGVSMPNRAMGYALRDGEVSESDQSITSATKGDGCLYTSIADYRKWMAAVVNNRLFDLKEELKSVNYVLSEGVSYGLGWFNSGGEELFHTGSTSGFSHVVWMTLDGRNALVYFSNLADHHAPAFLLEKELAFRKPAFSMERLLGLTD